MFRKTTSTPLVRWMRACVSLGIIATVILSAFPLGLAQAVSVINESSAALKTSMDLIDGPPVVTSNREWTHPASVAEDESLQIEPPPMSVRTPLRNNPLHNSAPFVELGLPEYESSMELTSSGMPQISSSMADGLPNSIDPRSLPDGITIDLTYDVVMGFVDPGEAVNVTLGTEGYGAAVADGVGLFWTLIWHNTDGYQLGVDCGDSISIVVGTDPAIEVVPPCMTGGIDVISDQVSGSITGDTGGTSVTATLGSFDFIFLGGASPPPPGSPQVTGTTIGDGSFDLSFTGVADLGAESMVSLDFDLGSVKVRSYLYPESPVFMVHQYNAIAGFASVNQSVTATVYQSDGTTERWSSSMNASYPHGFYAFLDVPIEINDVIEVALDGGPTLTTDVIALGDFNFDVVADTLEGTAPSSQILRASMRQWSGEDQVYKVAYATATSGDTFTMSFSPTDLRSRDEVFVVASDTNGNQIQIASGPPFVSAYISLDSNLDCVLGRLDGQDFPIFVSLDKGAGQVYTRETGQTTDVGNKYDGCFVLRDSEDNIVDFSPGDVVTLNSDNPSNWSGSVEVVDFTWSGDTANDIISGTTTDGDLELTVHQWQWYPVHGTATMQVPVSGGGFVASFANFDVRDGVTMDFIHYDATTGYGTKTNNWGYWPTLAYFELDLPYGISGMVGSPGEMVEAWLYDTDGTTLLGYTNEDGDDDPYSFWLDFFVEHTLEAGYKVVVSTSGGWSGEMIVPDMSIDGDVSTDVLSAIGPTGLLYLEVWNDNSYIGQFVPGPTALLDLGYFGWDLQPSDHVSVTYQAGDGSRARVQSPLIEVSDVEFFFNPGSDDWMWGHAKPGTIVTAEKESTTLFTAYADFATAGGWNIDEPLDLNPGDIITVTAGDGLLPVVIQIPDPLTAYADSSTDEVWGQIDHLDNEMVEVHGSWEDGYQEVYTDSSGNFSAGYTDIPHGADGYIRYCTMVDWSNIVFHQYFRTPDLALNVNYGHDWIEGWYPPGYPVTLMVLESDKTTVKATVSMTTSEIPWWGGGTGFSTNMEGTEWDPEQPDIQAGDWVLGEVEVDSVIYSSEVRVGTITGEVDITTDSITGTINAPWLPQDTEVPVWCDPNSGPDGTESKEDQVLPNGVDTYTCAWDPDTEWDIEAGNDIGVKYRTQEGHSIQNVFKAYTDELILTIHYDHDWIEGYYEPGHTVNLTVYGSEDQLKASISLPTGNVDGWGDTTGFATYQEGAEWVPDYLDIQPGDRIHGEVDDGSQYTADVVIGEVTGEADLSNDSISGTVYADWLFPGTVDVGCFIWENNGPDNKYDTVIPNGVDTYECSWSGEWDLVPGTNLMVAYFEPDGHQLIGDFSPSAPYLRIEKSFIGENPGEGGNAAFWVQYQNQGELTAEDVTITDTLVGMTYLSDTSGLTPAINGQVSWDFGTVDPGDWIGFYVFAEVAASEGEPVSNIAEISTSNPYDQGDESEKISTWEGTVAANDTHLNVGKDTWTQNPAPGEDFVYQINVCNNGSTGSSTVSLVDTLPDATSFVNWWGGDPGWVEVDVSGNPLVFEHTCISSWSCSELYIRVTVDPLAESGAELINQAEIYADNDLEHDDDATELQHNVGEPYVDLTIWQNWQWGSLVPGGHYRYHIYFRNDGNVAVNGPIEITATLPPGTSFAGWQGWEETESIPEPVIVGNIVTWEMGDMIAGLTGGIEVWVDIAPDTAPDTLLEHLADIEVQAEEENTENNHDEFVESVRDHGPNLRVQKWGDWSGEEEGQYAQWTIQLENIGDETVQDVVLTDNYPAQMEMDGGVNVNYWEEWHWADNDPEDNAFSVYLDRLEPGWNVNMNYNTYVREDVILVPLMVFTNIVDVPLLDDIEPTNNSYEYQLVFVGPQPYLQIEKWLIGENPGVGGNAAFYVQYRNQGGAPAEDVTITETLSGLTYLSDTSGLTPAINGQVSWDFGTVDPGDWIGFYVFTEVAASEGEPVSNIAEISTSNPYDQGDESEKTSTWEGTVAANDTHLNVGKDTWTWNPAPGEDFVYRVNVCNNGSTDSSAVTLTDTLPSNTAYVTWWGDPGWSEVDVSGNPLVFEHTCISSWSCSELYIRVTVDPLAEPGDELHNNVVIAADNDLSTGDDEADVYHNVGEPNMDLGIEQNWHWGSLVPGGYYRYGVHFYNDGNVAVAGPVEVVVTLPAGTSFAGWDSWGYIDMGDPVEDGNEVTWLLGDMLPGYYGTIEVWVAIESETTPGTVLEHLAEIEVQPEEGNTENNASSFMEMIYGHGPNLRITKYGGVHGHGDGHYAWYQLYVENIGDETVNDVVVTDYYPDGMELDGDVNVNWEAEWHRDLYADHFTITLDRLEPDWNIQIDYNMVIPGEDPIEPGLFFENTAEVYPMEEDVNPDDNTVSYMMATGPDMYVNKNLVEGEFLPGEQVTYLLEFGNKHHENAWWWEMAGNAILTDILPDGMSFVSAELHWCGETEWCEATPYFDGQILTWELYPLGGNDWNEIRLTVEIDSAVEGGLLLTNEVSITSDNSEADVDPYPENNADIYEEVVGYKLYLPLITN